MSSEVSVEKLVYGGDGLARLPGGQVVFVPYSAPGDVLSISCRSRGKGPLRGEIEHIAFPGTGRAEPPCSVFGTCGGCQWQHLDGATQREWKRRIVEESLRRIGKLSGITVLDTLGSNEAAWHYRNRVQWDIQEGRLGYRRSKSHALVAFDHCWIIPEPMNRLADWLQRYFDSHRDVADGLDRLEVAMNERDRMLVNLHTKSDPVVDRLAQDVMSAFPEIAGLVAGGSPLIGDNFLTHTLRNCVFRVSADSFFQTNRQGVEAMLEVLSGWLPESSDSLLDVYAGVGLFSIVFRERAQRIVGIESNAFAVADARENARLNSVTHLEIKEGAAERSLHALNGETFEVAVVDPPRAGCSPQVLDWLSRHVRNHVIYISCDPTTLSRDLTVLTGHGWRIEAIQPVDMFPQTYHIETMVHLSK